MGVEYLLGGEHLDDRPMRPYSDEVISFLGGVSSLLLKGPEARRWPDAAAFAFWARRANLQRLRDEAALEPNRLGRGVVFHVAPANIPVNFAFSCAFGLLAGNANLVRLPSRDFPQAGLMLRAFEAALEDFPAFRDRLAWVRYPAGDEATERFSLMADARMIWGGDGTVAAIRALPCAPRCVDLVFPDRYSIGLIDGEAVLRASEEELARLAEAFYNDTWLMDQNACSSPQLIVWLHASEGAKARFWDAALGAARRRYDLQPASASDKLVQMCGDAVRLEGLRRASSRTNLLYRAELGELPADLTELRGRCGYFYEFDAADLSDLTGSITAKFQTITYYGLDGAAIQRWVLEAGLRGVDRVVPFGRALDIGVIWDGYDIIRMLSRLAAEL